MKQVSTLKKVSFLTAVCLAALLVAGGSSARVACQPDEVVEADVVRQLENTTPTNDWVLYTRAGTPATAAQFVTGPANPPLGAGSLRLTTTTGSEKVFLFNYDHINKPLSSINAIQYSTFRAAGSGQQVTALNMQVDFNGPNVAGGFTTLVFEPVYNTAQGPVVNNAWQTWNATGGGVWWSTAAINGQCAGASTACQRTWSQIVANNPDAVITGGFGVNQGSGNAGLVAYVDRLVIGFSNDACATTYDFEPDADADTVGDGRDNCPNVSNVNQENFDNDALGDACDPDDDNDGFNDENDCAPKDASVNPGATETCNGADDDCDTVVDEGVQTTFYFDGDNDGYGNSAQSLQACAAPPGYVAAGGDCNDNNAAVNPGAAETCNGVDDNCNSSVDEGSLNTDGDSMADCVDPDDDNDNVLDGADNCPVVANPGQQDFDLDGIGDACDAQTGPAQNKEQCKNGGWSRFNTPRTFKNQGDCVQFVNTGK